MHWCTSGQDNKEDCAEAAVPELQALLPAPDQGTVHFSWAKHTVMYLLTLF